MSRYVLDSSYILAVLFREPLSSGALDFLEGATMSSFNLAEVWTKLQQAELLHSQEIHALLQLIEQIEPFTTEQAWTAGLLQTTTRHAGLSLGDRACLALALELNAEAITTNRVWAKVDVGCPIRVVR